MNIQVGELLKGIVSKAKFADKVAGLVQSISINTQGKEGVVTKVYPVSCTATHEQLKRGGYTELLPDHKYRSVMYFEDFGSTFEREGRFIVGTSTLRLICWANMKKLGSRGYNSMNMIKELFSLIPKMPFQYKDLMQVDITPTNQEIRDVGIFSKYTYNEELAQYLFYPYDYFAINFTVNYKMNDDCKIDADSHCC